MSKLTVISDEVAYCVVVLLRISGDDEDSFYMYYQITPDNAVAKAAADIMGEWEGDNPDWDGDKPDVYVTNTFISSTDIYGVL